MAKKRSARRQAAPVAAAVEPRPLGALFQVCLTVALLAVYAGFLAHPVDLTTSDLGRYLKNGELFFQRGLIAGTNLFAYTTPDHPFVNHSWGSGAIYYLVERTLGFAGLSLFFLAVSVTTLWIFFRLAVRYGSFALGAVCTVIVMPILITRSEIRPEMFSYLMSGLFLKSAVGLPARPPWRGLADDFTAVAAGLGQPAYLFFHRYVSRRCLSFAVIHRSCRAEIAPSKFPKAAMESSHRGGGGDLCR